MFALQLLSILVINVSIVSSLYSCYDGFVGRIRYPNEEEFRDVNETRMCAAKSCIQVTLHEAIDREGIYHEGISTRCAYTGGDRQLCRMNNCTDLQHYNGMRGKVNLFNLSVGHLQFKFCCCEGNGCNMVNASSFIKFFPDKELHKKDKTNGIGIRDHSIVLLMFGFCHIVSVLA
uniref:Activin_recp domain-containing protein n=1 Tax=Ascaris lumbricoides TaxID=6252 RepID=A0A0M3IEC8_ASCLU